MEMEPCYHRRKFWWATLASTVNLTESRVWDLPSICSPTAVSVAGALLTIFHYAFFGVQARMRWKGRFCTSGVGVSS